MFADISTIIPTRNRVSFLEKSILSVLNQKNITDNKIIICDNASEDSTSSLIKKYQSEYTGTNSRYPDTRISSLTHNHRLNTVPCVFHPQSRVEYHR